MESEQRAQDVLRCGLCETPDPPMYCETCSINLCKACVGEHLSDEAKEHKVVGMRKKGSTAICKKHSTKICELICEHCKTPICVLCVSSGDHEQHKKDELISCLSRKKKDIQKDLEEMQNSIYSKHQAAKSNIPNQREELNANSIRLKNAFDKQGEILHKQINTIIKNFKSKIDKTGGERLEVLNELEKEINQNLIQIEESIVDLKNKLDSEDPYIVAAYKSRNEGFRRLPSHFYVSLPEFYPKSINAERINREFGYISDLVTLSSSPLKNLTLNPRIVSCINTDFGGSKSLHSVVCNTFNEFWACGSDSTIRKYRNDSTLICKIEVKSDLNDIAVTRRNDIVYTVKSKTFIYIAKSGYPHCTQELIKLEDFEPRGLCITSSGDILVILVRDYSYAWKKGAKIVRYSISDSTEKQSMDLDKLSIPFSLKSTTYINENKNLDISVSDFGARAVVVINASGKLRFRYAGHSYGSFGPLGITTDIQSRLLVADGPNNLIHILDQDGHFLRYLDNCQLLYPWGLYIDSGRQLLVVAERDTGKLKCIEYCEYF